jgi:hypothetical protein
MNPRCHDTTHPPLKGGVTVTNPATDRLAAAVRGVQAMSRDEFYARCEAIGLRIVEDHNSPTPRHPIALRQRNAEWVRSRQDRL